MVHTVPDRANWVWALGLIFPVLTVACMSASATVVPFLILAVLAAGFVLWRIGLALSCGLLCACVAPVVLWKGLIAIPIAILPFLPLMLRGGSEQGVAFPYAKQLLLLLIGFALVHVTSAITTGVVNTGALGWDLQIILMLVMCVVTFSLLRNGAFSPHRFAVLVSACGVPFLAMLVVKYVKNGNIGGILSGRLGNSVDFSSNLVAMPLDLIIPFPLFLFIHERRRPAKALYLTLTFIYAMAIMLTYSRGSLFGLVAIAFYLTLKHRTRGSIVFLLCAGAVFLFFFSAQFLLRFQAKEMSDMVSNFGRVLLYSTAVKMLEAGHFLVGTGMNQFSSAKFEFGFPHWFDPNAKLSTHNIYLEMWVSWGLAGIVGWVWLMVSNTAGLLFGRFDERDRHVRLAVAFAILSFALHGLVDSVLAMNYAMLLLFSIVGCGAYLSARRLPLSQSAPSC